MAELDVDLSELDRFAERAGEAGRVYARLAARLTEHQVDSASFGRLPASAAAAQGYASRVAAGMDELRAAQELMASVAGKIEVARQTYQDADTAAVEDVDAAEAAGEGER